MKISVFGLGYVGVVSVACLSSLGHKLIGVDTNDDKVDMVNKGISPIIEKDVNELLEKAKKQDILSATNNAAEAIQNTDISLICVGTPSTPEGSIDLKYVKMVTEEIALALKNKQEKHILVFRSTMIPGSMKSIVIPTLEAISGKKQNVDFFVAYNPEFLRTSTAVFDFFNPPKTIVGADSEEIANEIITSVYKDLPGPKIVSKIETAEMVKYVDNNFHALKVTFANEVGYICKSLGIDSHEVMNIFVQDTKLNVSPTYFKPGFAFGGSCLPKDLRAINYISKTMNLDTPMLNSIISSNKKQISNAIKKIKDLGKRKIGFAGISFKAGTDDLRESPLLEMIENLQNEGFEIKIYDRNISNSKLFGANKDYLDSHVANLSSMMVTSLDELLSDREVIIIGNKDNEFKNILTSSKDEQFIIDTVKIDDNFVKRANYEGICW